MKELDFLGFPSYFVTDTGKVWSEYSKTFLQGVIGTNGYVSVTLLTDNGLKKNVTVHRLVAKAFIANTENKPYVNHIDGDKTNNCLSNLEWATARENVAHALETGLRRTGEPSTLRELSDQTVQEICEKLADGWRNCDVARATGVPASVVGKIRLGSHYKHVSRHYKIPNGNRKIRVSAEKVRMVCERLGAGWSNGRISKEVGVTWTCVQEIRERKIFTEVSKEYAF